MGCSGSTSAEKAPPAAAAVPTGKAVSDVAVPEPDRAVLLKPAEPTDPQKSHEESKAEDTETVTTLPKEDSPLFGRDVKETAAALFGGSGQRVDGKPIRTPQSSPAVGPSPPPMPDEEVLMPWIKRIPGGVKWTSPPYGYGESHMTGAKARLAQACASQHAQENSTEAALVMVYLAAFDEDWKRWELPFPKNKQEFKQFVLFDKALRGAQSDEKNVLTKNVNAAARVALDMTTDSGIDHVICRLRLVSKDNNAHQETAVFTIDSILRHAAQNKDEEIRSLYESRFEKHLRHVFKRAIEAVTSRASLASKFFEILGKWKERGWFQEALPDVVSVVEKAAPDVSKPDRLIAEDMDVDEMSEAELVEERFKDAESGFSVMQSVPVTPGMPAASNTPTGQPMTPGYNAPTPGSMKMPGTPAPTTPFLKNIPMTPNTTQVMNSVPATPNLSAPMTPNTTRVMGSIPATPNYLAVPMTPNTSQVMNSVPMTPVVSSAPMTPTLALQSAGLDPTGAPKMAAETPGTVKVLDSVPSTPPGQAMPTTPGTAAVLQSGQVLRRKLQG
eukprot:s2908_g17.t1